MWHAKTQWFEPVFARSVDQIRLRFWVVNDHDFGIERRVVPNVGGGVLPSVYAEKFEILGLRDKGAPVQALWEDFCDVQRNLSWPPVQCTFSYLKWRSSCFRKRQPAIQDFPLRPGDGVARHQWRWN